MLEAIDLTQDIEKEEYRKKIMDLQIELSSLQRQLRELKIPVLIIFEGWDAAGKGTQINRLLTALDPRGVNVFSTQPSTEEEKLYPFLWRFWNKIPPQGKITILDRSWYTRAIIEKTREKRKIEQTEKFYQSIEGLERYLTDEGILVIKMFLHISKKEQKKRMKKLKKDPATRWRVSKIDWKNHKNYEKIAKAVEYLFLKSNYAFTPWKIIAAENKNWATVQIFEHIIDKMKQKIEKKQQEIREIPYTKLPFSILDKTDLSQKMTKEEYNLKIKELQEKMREIEHRIYEKRIPVVIVYEGWDAAGKGGNIRRLVEKLDPRGYTVIPVAAPNAVEKSYPYLWRFWIKIPKAGHIAIFDRSWYGRVLVERVEGFCSEWDWKRAYTEINDFEKHLVDFNTVIFKFWLHISKEEQLKRFEERQNTPHKNWKITEEDWRNREKWDIYKKAIDEMFFHTSTTYAPWTIIEAENKYFARIKTLETIITTLEKKLKNKRDVLF